MTKFVKIQSCYRGHTEDELINIDDIGRICLGPNILFLRTSYNLGEHHISITQNSVDKLLKVLDIIGEDGKLDLVNIHFWEEEKNKKHRRHYFLHDQF
ncbi:TPA: hypothetical protein ACOJZX_001720 [Streptococcus pneumoniae]